MLLGKSKYNVLSRKINIQKIKFSLLFFARLSLFIVFCLLFCLYAPWACPSTIYLMLVLHSRIAVSSLFTCCFLIFRRDINCGFTFERCFLTIAYVISLELCKIFTCWIMENSLYLCLSFILCLSGSLFISSFLNPSFIVNILFNFNLTCNLVLDHSMITWFENPKWG